MTSINHLSYSSISTYTTCGRSWFYRYVQRVLVPTAPALAFGSAFHGAVEEYVSLKVFGQQKSLAESWEVNWAEACQGEIAWDGELPEQMANEGLKLLTHPDTVKLLDSLVPLMVEEKPVIEKRITLRVPGVPIPIIGYIDIITGDGVPGDFKTASRAWNQEQAEKETQPLFYLAALNQAGYSLNPEHRFRHYVFVKTRTPQVQVIESQHSPSQMFWLFKSITEVWQGIEAGLYPTNPGSWKCSEKWCEYWRLCRGKI